MGSIQEIVFDCENPANLANFWAEILEGYHVRDFDQVAVDRLAALGFNPETDTAVFADGPGPSMCFQNVEGRRYDNNRVHFDILVQDRAEEVERLTAAGAAVVQMLPTYAVLRDPEGNQFCLVDAREDIAA
ncbi:VOC family protein [Devosia rhodophyticola]|uniref:VOC family protein n=1 Tax=Devosia rhodophyticola TaxID=3026423 RepID=A0ABY7YVI9_9HYPH|nr:VOC family protein [Devosia rhodophyticola]WDR05065.1 VOC family protein [Devosia rhodophyticola]